jgi:2-iminobutanoate/2-iminopropanoate deaminase
VKQRVQTGAAPAAIGPYSQGIKAGEFVFTAGQVGFDPQTGKLVEGGIEAQTRQGIENVRAILEAAGTSLDNVVKTTVFLTNLADFQAMNAIYKGYFGEEQPPARSTIQVAGLPGGAIFEIETIALLPNGE